MVRRSTGYLEMTSLVRGSLQSAQNLDLSSIGAGGLKKFIKGIRECKFTRPQRMVKWAVGCGWEGGQDRLYKIDVVTSTSKEKEGLSKQKQKATDRPFTFSHRRSRQRSRDEAYCEGVGQHSCQIFRLDQPE